jgi:hypothetical protein
MPPEQLVYVNSLFELIASRHCIPARPASIAPHQVDKGVRIFALSG